MTKITVKHIFRYILYCTLFQLLAACKPSATENFTVNGVTFEMVKVEGGAFTMGAMEPDSEANENEKPAHQVSLSDYYIGKHEVTVGQFRAFVDETGFVTDAERTGGSHVWTYNGGWHFQEGVTWRCDVGGEERPQAEDNHPVVHVSWNDANAFCDWLSGKTGKNFALPTEAQWEFAARGGNHSKGYKYSGSNDVDKIAWHEGNSGLTTHAVGTKAPNELGIHDMTGNVWEWCQDWYGDYADSAQENPSCPSSGVHRVMRGGSWYFNASLCRIPYRYYRYPGFWGHNRGFRLAMQ